MPKKRKRELPRPLRTTKESRLLAQQIRTRRYYGPDAPTIVKMAKLVAVNGHPCRTWFWGTSSAYLNSLLPLATTPTGIAAFLPRETWDALLAAQRRIEVALPVKPTDPRVPWQGGIADESDLLTAAYTFIFDLDADRDDRELPDHHLISTNGWLATGVMEHNSDVMLRSTLSRVRNALNS